MNLDALSRIHALMMARERLRSRRAEVEAELARLETDIAAVEADLAKFEIKERRQVTLDPGLQDATQQEIEELGARIAVAIPPATLPPKSDAERAAIVLLSAGAPASLERLNLCNPFADVADTESRRAKLVNAMQHLKRLFVVVSPRRGHYDFTADGRRLTEERASKQEHQTPKT